MSDEEKPMTEQMLIEAMDQLKEKFDLNEYLMKKMENRLLDLKKELFTSYGLIRLIDNMVHQSYDIDSDIITLIESLRGHLSKVIEEII